VTGPARPTGTPGGGAAPASGAGRDVVFQIAGGEPRLPSGPLSHVSIEVGHLSQADLAGGPDRLREQFRQVAPWLDAARRTWAAVPAPGPVRVSTCLLVDDYSVPVGAPAEVAPQLLAAAQESGVAVDYLAREAACVELDGVSLARLVAERIVAEPPPGTDGFRPPVLESGWLCNGQRAPAAAAMEPAAGWRPPVQDTAYPHAVFTDVQLWDERRGTRRWSCAFLAAVWQLLRLGLLRSQGAPVAVPQPWPDELPDSWGLMPAVIQVNPRATPFSAYRTFSILPVDFLAIEHAVRTILSQVAVDAAVLVEIAGRAAADGVRLPDKPMSRITYTFIE